MTRPTIPGNPTPSTGPGPQPNNPRSTLTMEEVEGWLARLRRDIDYLLRRRTGGDTPVNDPFTFVWSNAGATPGNLAVVGDDQGARPQLDRDCTFSGVHLNAKTGPSGAAFIVDWEWASSASGPWTTLFSTKPQINSGSLEGGGGAVFSVASLSAGSLLRLNVDQTGGAADWTCQLKMLEA